MHTREHFHGILHLLIKERNAGFRSSEQTLIALEQLALEDGYEWEEQEKGQ